MNIAFIVEGHSETESLPILARRILEERHEIYTAKLNNPIRLNRSNFGKATERFEKSFKLACLQVKNNGLIVILADSDDDSPPELKASILECCNDINSSANTVVSLAVREYEAWLIAAANSLRTSSKIDPQKTSKPENIESIRDAKGTLSSFMSEKYKETLHQPAFTAIFDIEEAAGGSESFSDFLTQLSEKIELFRNPNID